MGGSIDRSIGKAQTGVQTGRAIKFSTTDGHDTNVDRGKRTRPEEEYGAERREPSRAKPSPAAVEEQAAAEQKEMLAEPRRAQRWKDKCQWGTT